MTIRIKRGFMFLVLLAAASNTYSQKNDYIWLSGYDSNVGFSSHWGFYFGTSVMNFNYNPRKISYDTLKMNFDFTNTSYCDSNGNLLFYTNGIYIANSLDEKIENSDSMNAGYVQYVWDHNIEHYGYRNANGIFAIPSITNKDQYYLIHSWDDTDPVHELLCKKTLATLLDMSANNGLGKVIYKNQPVLTGILGWELAITRHGNGRDWWVIVQKRSSNCYYRILIDSSGPHVLPDLTCGGAVRQIDEAGTSCFSPDGTKFAYMSTSAGLDIFDFDRCAGELSNPVNIPLHQNWIGRGLAVSPNNRFLYVSLTYFIYQIDLWASDIPGSIDTVGVYYADLRPYAPLYNNAQLGPDGKIYIGCGNSDTVFHVINNPDIKGDSCNFVQCGIHLPTPSDDVPSFPNYRLGALTGSACDTLTGLSDDMRAEKEKTIKVFPNPATDYVVVDYGFTDWNKGEIYLEITNELGQTIYEQRLPMYSGFQKIDVSSYAAGVYMAYIKRQGNMVAVAKFARQ